MYKLNLQLKIQVNGKREKLSATDNALASSCSQFMHTRNGRFKY